MGRHSDNPLGEWIGDVLEAAGEAFTEVASAPLDAKNWRLGSSSTVEPTSDSKDSEVEEEATGLPGPSNSDYYYSDDDYDSCDDEPDERSTTPSSLDLRSAVKSLVKSAVREAARPTSVPTPSSPQPGLSAAQRPGPGDILAGLVGLAIIGGVISAVVGSRPPVTSQATQPHRGMPFGIGVLLIILLVICLVIIGVLSVRP